MTLDELSAEQVTSATGAADVALAWAATQGLVPPEHITSVGVTWRDERWIVQLALWDHTYWRLVIQDTSVITAEMQADGDREWYVYQLRTLQKRLEQQISAVKALIARVEGAERARELGNAMDFAPEKTA